MSRVTARVWLVGVLVVLVGSMALARPTSALPMGDVSPPGGASVVAVVKVGIAPLGPLLDPTRHRMYVVNGDSGTVSVVDTDGYRVIDTIRIGDDLGAGALDAGSHRLYVPLTEAARVAVIDTRSDELIDTIKVGRLPEHLVLDVARHQLFVSNALSGTLSVIDTRTDSVVTTIRLADAPGVASSDDPPLIGGPPVLDARRGLLYQAGSPTSVVEPGLVWVIDARTRAIVGTVPVGKAPEELALDARRGRLFVANHRSDTVSVVDTTSHEVVATIDVPVYGAMAYDSIAQRLYMPDRGDSLSVVSTTSNSIIDAVATGKWPEPLVDPVEKRLYVTSYDGYVAVLDSRTYRQLGTIEFAGWPQRPVLDSAQGRLLVPDWDDLEVHNDIVVIDTRRFDD